MYTTTCCYTVCRLDCCCSWLIEKTPKSIFRSKHVKSTCDCAVPVRQRGQILATAPVLDYTLNSALFEQQLRTIIGDFVV